MISVKRSNQAKVMMEVLLFFPFLFGMLIELFKLPTYIKYVCDVAWIYLGLLIIIQKNTYIHEEKNANRIIAFFFLYTLIIYLFNYQSLIYYSWGVRNNFRFYIAFIGFMIFLKKEDISSFFSILEKFFWINAVVCIIQYFFFGYSQDFLGGIFGVIRGCNAYTNNFFVIITIKTILNYLSNKEDTKYFLIKSITILFISALAELKFFYIEFVIILVMAIAITDFSWKKIIIALIGTIGTITAITVLINLFPEFTGFFSMDNIIETATSKKGYTGSGELNRLTTVPIISERFLNTWPKKLFGLGLGNCDTATFEVLNTPFYKKYGWLRYNWFSTAFIYLETGFIGLFFYIWFYISVALGALKIGKKYPEDKQYCQMAVITAVCCLLIMIYNSSLRTEAGYMMYFVMAIPFAINRWHKKEELFHEKTI